MNGAVPARRAGRRLAEQGFRSCVPVREHAVVPGEAERWAVGCLLVASTLQQARKWEQARSGSRRPCTGPEAAWLWAGAHAGDPSEAAPPAAPAAPCGRWLLRSRLPWGLPGRVVPGFSFRMLCAHLEPLGQGQGLGPCISASVPGALCPGNRQPRAHLITPCPRRSPPFFQNALGDFDPA